MDLKSKPVRMVSLYNTCLYHNYIYMLVGRRVSGTKAGIAGGSEATGNLGGDQSVEQIGGVQTANLVSTRVTGDNEDSDSNEWSSTEVSENEDQDAGIDPNSVIRIMILIA